MILGKQSIYFDLMIPLPHHRAPEERAGGGVVGGRVYRVDDGDIKSEDIGTFVRSRDVGDGRYVVELGQFVGFQPSVKRSHCTLTPKH